MLHGRALLPLKRRLEDNISKQPNGGCWNWIGANHGRDLPYGCLTINKKQRKAHRVMYELLVGKIPDGLEIDHLCKNTLCVNPKHLEPVTRKENLRRGMGPSAINARKTVCSKGHPFYGINKYGRRTCRICEPTREIVRVLS